MILILMCTSICCGMIHLPSDDIFKKRDMKAIEEAKRNPKKDIVYIGMNTWRQSRISSFLMGEFREFNDTKSYALSIPDCIWKIREQYKQHKCSIVLFDDELAPGFPSFDLNYQVSSLYQFLKENKLSLATANITLAESIFTDLDIKKLKIYIEQIIQTGGLVILGEFKEEFQSVKGRGAIRIIDLYNELSSRFPGKIVLLMGVNGGLMDYEPLLMLNKQVFEGVIAFWWNGNQFNEIDYFKLKYRVNQYNWMIAKSVKDPNLVRSLLYDRDTTLERMFGRMGAGGDKIFSYRAPDDTKISMKDIVDQSKPLECTPVALTQLQDQNKFPLLELNITTNADGSLSFKMPKISQFNYLDFTPYISTFVAWGIPEDKLRVPEKEVVEVKPEQLRAPLKDLHDDLTSIWARVISA